MRRSNSFRALAAIAGLSATMTLASCSSGGGGGDDKVTGKLNGAGASFPAAIYQRWFQELQPEGVTVNYQSSVPVLVFDSSRPTPWISVHRTNR